MTCGFVLVRRIAAISVTIALFAAPIASAQTPSAAPPSPNSANTVLLSPAAFARLVQSPPAEVGPVPAMSDSTRPSLLRQGTAATAREAQTAPAKAPQQKSWASRHKLATGLLVVGAIFGAIMIGVVAAYGDE